MTDLNFPRTTLFVIDKDTWISSKAIAERLGYSSVSEYIFNLLKADQTRQLSLQLLLLELEKYYEMDHYNLELVAEKTSLPLRIVIDIMNSLNLPLPEAKSSFGVFRIHEELIKNKLLPREIQSILGLKRQFEKKELLSNSDMLAQFFPNEDERTLEILTRTREILLDILERDLEIKDENGKIMEFDQKFCDNCKTKAKCKYADFKQVFYEFGLNYEEDFISNDPIFNRLRICNAENLFGRFIEFSSVELIKKELTRIEEFRLGQIIEIPLPEIKRQQEKIDKEQERLKEDLKIYLKCVASANRASANSKLNELIIMKNA
jgi:hypothetical protein